MLHFTSQGFYSTPATPASLTMSILIGGTIRITTGAVVQLASVTNGVWQVSCDITTRTTGVSGTQIANCIFVGTGATLTPGEAPMQTSATWTIDTTATQAIDLQATWSTATGAPTITSTNIGAWIPGAPVTSVNGATGAVVITVTAGTGISVSGGTGITPTVSTTATIRTRQFGTSFGDTGGTALTSGSVVYFTVAYACTISAWNATVDAGTVTFDIWKIGTGTAIPTVTNTITASALPAISTGTAIHSTTLTAWTTSVTANDIFGIQLKTVATAKYAELDIECDQ